MRNIFPIFPFLLIIACVHNDSGPIVTDNGLDPSDIPQLNDSDLKQQYNRLINLLKSDFSAARSSGFSGVARLSYRTDVLYQEAFGLRDRNTSAPMTQDTGFDIGSITKIFTSAAILDLVNRGLVELDAPVGNYLPQLSGPASKITPRQLLTHRSGLPEYFGGDYELLDKTAAINRISKFSLPVVEDRHYQYSNTGFSLLAILIEAASGQTYEQYLQTHLLEPVSISMIGYIDVGWENSSLAVGYRGSTLWGTPIDQPWLPDGPSWTLRGNGGLLATTAQLDEWFSALFKNELVEPLDPALLLGGEGFTEPRKFGEAGGNDIFSATVERWIDPEIQLTIFSSNALHTAEDLNETVSNVFSSIAQILIEAEEREVCIHNCL